MKCTNMIGNWNLDSTEDGIRIVNELAWSRRQTPEDEFEAVRNMTIRKAINDQSGENGMLFLLSGTEQTPFNEKPCFRLMKVAPNGNGELEIHSLPLSEADHDLLMHARPRE